MDQLQYYQPDQPPEPEAPGVWARISNAIREFFEKSPPPAPPTPPEPQLMLCTPYYPPEPAKVEEPPS